MSGADHHAPLPGEIPTEIADGTTIYGRSTICHTHGYRPMPRPFGDHSAIKRDYLPNNYDTGSAPLNVTATVHVQTHYETPDPSAETTRLADALPDLQIIIDRLETPRPDRPGDT